MIRVTLNLEVDTDLESVDNIVEHIDFGKLFTSGDDVVDVTSVEVEDFQKI